MKEGLLGGTLDVSPGSESEEARLDVARWTGSRSPQDRRVPVVRRGRGRRWVGLAARRRRASRVAARAATWGPAVGGVVESMNDARLVRDRLEEHGWDVLIVDATRVEGLAPLACKADRIDARVLAELSGRDLVAEIWLPDRSIRRVRALARVSAASRPASRDAEEPRPRGADRVRSPVPGLGSVWSWRPRAA
jgi:hypothetical protein